MQKQCCIGTHELIFRDLGFAVPDHFDFSIYLIVEEKPADLLISNICVDPSALPHKSSILATHGAKIIREVTDFPYFIRASVDHDHVRTIAAAHNQELARGKRDNTRSLSLSE